MSEEDLFSPVELLTQRLNVLVRRWQLQETLLRQRALTARQRRSHQTEAQCAAHAGALRRVIAEVEAALVGDPAPPKPDATSTGEDLA
jgi:hypothetical protein